MELRTESSWSVSQAEIGMSRVRQIADRERIKRARHDRDVILTVGAQIEVVEKELELLSELLTVAEL